MNTNDFKIILSVLTVGFLSVLTFIIMLSEIAAIPTVEISYSLDKCVTVINYDKSDYNCDNMPVKYAVNYVK